jgi:hypothetical protein
MLHFFSGTAENTPTKQWTAVCRTEPRRLWPGGTVGREKTEGVSQKPGHYILRHACNSAVSRRQHTLILTYSDGENEVTKAHFARPRGLRRRTEFARYTLTSRAGETKVLHWIRLRRIYCVRPTAEPPSGRVRTLRTGFDFVESVAFGLRPSRRRAESERFSGWHPRRSRNFGRRLSLRTALHRRD